MSENPTGRGGHPATRDRNRWPSRVDVARQLGVDRRTVGRWEGRHLHPCVDDNGVHRFDPEEVKQLRCKPSTKKFQAGNGRGAVVAAITRMLQAGYTRPEIVIALKVEYEEIQSVWEQLQAVTCQAADRLKRQREEEEYRRQEDQRQQREWDKQLQEALDISSRLAAGLNKKGPPK